MKTVTDYSINKLNQDAIVYIDANGVETRLTVNDFESEEEFRKWKQWSDEDYHEIEKGDHIEDYHCISENEVTGAYSPSAETVLIRQEELAACNEAIIRIQQIVTPAQYRRMSLHYLDGKSIKEVGRIEGVSHQVAGKRIRAGLRRAQKYMVNKK